VTMNFEGIHSHFLDFSACLSYCLFCLQHLVKYIALTGP
jgi:hypothetical protein